MLSNNEKRLNIFLSLSNPYDYLEFTQKCGVARIEPLGWTEYAQKAEVVMEAQRVYPDIPVSEAYIKIYKDRGNQLTALPPAGATQACCGDAPPSPATLDQIKSAGLALTKWVASGGANVTAADRAERLQHCGKCEHLANERCQICGCFVKIKTWMATEACPKEKWRAV